MKLTLLMLLTSIVAFALFSITVVAEYNAPWRDLAPPEVGLIWVQPAVQGGEPAMPIWGHADGLRVGLWPMPGPRPSRKRKHRGTSPWEDLQERIYLGTDAFVESLAKPSESEEVPRSQHSVSRPSLAAD